MSVFLVKQKTFKAYDFIHANPNRPNLKRWKTSVNKVCLLQSMMAYSHNSTLLRGNVWPKLEKLLERKPSPNLTTRFREQVRISAAFLIELAKERKVEVVMTVEFQDKNWIFKFTINAKGNGVFFKRMTDKEKSEFTTAIMSGEGKLTIELIFGEAAEPTPVRPLFAQEQITSIARKMLDEQIQCDLQLISQDGTVFPCHKAFLAVHSTWFHQLFQNKPEEKVWKISMTLEGLRAFLNYVYYVDMEVPKKDLRVAVELLKVGNKYSIVPLEKDMKNLLLEFQTSAMSVEVALLLFCFARKVKGYDLLKMKAIKLMKWNLTKVSELKDLQGILGNDSDTVKELELMGLYK
ncbi:BTB/POZ domain-containing protein [Orchesella cincta]|uniref:BTB/POZ domain-containing protein n=1 Tax=Orchesella cincta TaxID=48709 RepID=A0A1D2MPG1_ORCCI|nr:BTB/POZ domain-containing protein [Orchesella cincta]